MVMVKTKCPSCGGVGTLPALEQEGDLRDIKRFFPRPCDTCHCSRFVYIDTKIEENPKPGTENEGYIAGQGDCD
jgi:hypothetical protein